MYLLGRHMHVIKEKLCLHDIWHSDNGPADQELTYSPEQQTSMLHIMLCIIDSYLGCDWLSPPL